MSADADLKAWAVWIIHQRDGGVGWNKSSPVANFGMPSSDSWGSGVDLWRATGRENEAFDALLRSGLGSGEYNLLKTFYVENHCQLRRAARFCSIAPSTLRKYLDLILAKIDALQNHHAASRTLIST